MPEQAHAPKKTAAKRSAKTVAKKSANGGRTTAARGLSEDHKQALAVGRTEGRAVRAYLEALELHKPKRGRRRTPDSVQRRLDQIELDLPYADPLSRVHFLQEQLDLQAELEAGFEPIDLSSLEDGFVEAAKGYSERRGLTYAAWREVGIDPGVLRRAGIGRSTRS